MSEFVNEIKNYRQMQLGEREKEILSFIFYQNYSAYDILKIHRDDLKKPMGYKDIHQRLKRLELLELIEIAERHKRRKILYKLTSRGLFEVFLNNNKYVPEPSILNKNKDNIILKTLLYQFFETKTIKKFDTFARYHLLRDYLRNCCQSLISEFEHPLTAREIKISEIDDLIREDARELVFQIITSKIKSSSTYSSRHIPYNDPVILKYRFGKGDDEDENGPNYAGLFPTEALRSDRKFMKLLKEIKKDFDKGCQSYLA